MGRREDEGRLCTPLLVFQTHLILWTLSLYINVVPMSCSGNILVGDSIFICLLSLYFLGQDTHLHASITPVCFLRDSSTLSVSVFVLVPGLIPCHDRWCNNTRRHSSLRVACSNWWLPDCYKSVVQTFSLLAEKPFNLLHTPAPLISSLHSGVTSHLGWQFLHWPQRHWGHWLLRIYVSEVKMISKFVPQGLMAWFGVVCCEQLYDERNTIVPITEECIQGMWI